MKIETQKTGDCMTARLGDRMTFSDHGPFRAFLESVSKSGAQRCLIDLSDLKSVDSAGLGMFVIAQEEARKNGWSLKLKGPQGHVKQLLELARFDKLIAIEA